MKHSEFWDVMERVFPKGRARSVAQDLVLPQLNSLTPSEALEQGIAPQTVWNSIVAVEGLPQHYEYLHRVNPKDASSV
ncbi:MAG: DUF3046 domain-containing protein [Actinomycetaceae bacterium]|nr:DUF3046 domain-containing protein [Arcanobacterium sp.]MDD7687337.1 DUF3046 domain-containing protein [Actinomycetaceae bacterium]MDY5274106.1 DUF3046 domain-containing protein [Arcanobacterium sp.]